MPRVSLLQCNDKYRDYQILRKLEIKTKLLNYINNRVDQEQIVEGIA